MSEQMVLKVEGMDCAGCEQRLATAVGRVDGVLDATADHTAGTLQVELGPGADRGAVTARVAEAGYSVTDQETGS